MARKVVRVTMPICSAPMQNNQYMRKCVNEEMRVSRHTWTHCLIYSSTRSRISAFTFTELVIVLVMVSLFVSLAQVYLFGLLRKNTFRAQVQDFVATMQMAARAAAESDRRYEVIIDLTEQSYLLRQITSPDLSQVLQEEIITANSFGQNCRVAYVEFDDGDYTNQGLAKFRAGHAGWHYGGKIVLLDEKEQPYSVVVNRINRVVQLEEGDVPLLVPKDKNELSF